mmetsp:Transcript_10234/g.9893  ORF Transcript_10234/g.9893 Transcript_10234/m.9893 type:complete len:130 (-) Transcript_10234:1326-1715(-)
MTGHSEEENNTTTTTDNDKDNFNFDDDDNDDDDLDSAAQDISIDTVPSLPTSTTITGRTAGTTTRGTGTIVLTATVSTLDGKKSTISPITTSTTTTSTSTTTSGVTNNTADRRDENSVNNDITHQLLYR